MLKNIAESIKNFYIEDYPFSFVVTVLFLVFWTAFDPITGVFGDVLGLATTAATLYAVYLRNKFADFKRLNVTPRNWKA